METVRRQYPYLIAASLVAAIPLAYLVGRLDSSINSIFYVLGGAIGLAILPLTLARFVGSKAGWGTLCVLTVGFAYMANRDSTHVDTVRSDPLGLTARVSFEACEFEVTFSSGHPTTLEIFQHPEFGRVVHARSIWNRSGSRVIRGAYCLPIQRLRVKSAAHGEAELFLQKISASIVREFGAIPIRTQFESSRFGPSVSAEGTLQARDRSKYDSGKVRTRSTLGERSLLTQYLISEVDSRSSEYSRVAFDFLSFGSEIETAAKGAYSGPGCEFSVVFPDTPNIEVYSHPKIGDYEEALFIRDAGKHGSVFLRAECARLPGLQTLLEEHGAERFLFDQLQIFSRDNGLSAISYQFSATGPGPSAVARGVKYIHETPTTYVIKVVAGNDSLLTLYAGGESLTFPHPEVSPFLSSVGRHIRDAPP